MECRSRLAEGVSCRWLKVSVSCEGRRQAGGSVWLIWSDLFASLMRKVRCRCRVSGSKDGLGLEWLTGGRLRCDGLWTDRFEAVDRISLICSFCWLVRMCDSPFETVHVPLRIGRAFVGVN